jgi:hypothetical protein
MKQEKGNILVICHHITYESSSGPMPAHCHHQTFAAIQRILHVLMQGCQIFLGTMYQNGKIYAKLPQNIPNGRKKPI